MFVFERWHSRNTQGGTLTEAYPGQISRSVRAVGKYVVLIKLSALNAVMDSALRQNPGLTPQLVARPG